MQALPYRVLALDLDGTLTNSQKVITPFTQDIVTRAAKMGLKIVLASGRPVPGVMPLAKQLRLEDLDGYLLAANGAQLLSCREHRVLYEATMPPSLLPRMKAMADVHGLTMICYDEQSLVTDRPGDPLVIYEARNDSMSIRYARDLAAAVTWPSHKIMLVGHEDKVEACRRCAEAAFAGELHVFLSEKYFLEFTAPGVSKETGLIQLLHRLQLDPETLLAFGDGLNDIPMLQLAGMGVAMENAWPEVRRAADRTALSNDQDGVAVALQELFPALV